MPEKHNEDRDKSIQIPFHFISFVNHYLLRSGNVKIKWTCHPQNSLQFHDDLHMKEKMLDKQQEMASAGPEARIANPAADKVRLHKP